MPDLLDRIYCSEQIHIPPTFPYIMKLYCKAAIRTQPYDLLKWSAAYFRALANGEEPPAKERVEYPPYDSPSGLTPGYIKILINQFGKDPSTTITARTLFKKWSDICLQEHLLIQLIALLGATTAVNWVKFVGVCAGFISKTLTQTMVLICELFTEEPEGGMATIPYDLFIDLYMFLAQMECGPLTDKEKEQQEAIMFEEDECEVVEKVKQGIYGEAMPGEEYYGEVVEEEAPEEEEGVLEEEKVAEEEEIFPKETDAESILSIEEIKVIEEPVPVKEEEEPAKEEKREEEVLVASEKSSDKEVESLKSKESVEGEVPIAPPADLEEEVDLEEKQPVLTSKKKEEEEEEETPQKEEVTKPKKISLEDLEESIRERIKEKLDEEEESYEQEEDDEFENLTSYLLGASARVQKYTAEALGYRIFKKYMRQEVPGIGPYVETEQVEKVVNFMDFWSHKQEQMVMPRNIRHWMCPPLDRVPPPEP